MIRFAVINVNVKKSMARQNGQLIIKIIVELKLRSKLKLMAFILYSFTEQKPFCESTLEISHI